VGTPSKKARCTSPNCCEPASTSGRLAADDTVAEYTLSTDSGVVTYTPSLTPSSKQVAAAGTTVVATDPATFNPFDCDDPNCNGCVLARRMLAEKLTLEASPPSQLVPAMMSVLSRSLSREEQLAERCAQQRCMCYVLRVPFPERTRSGGWRINELPTVLCANQHFYQVLGYRADELSNSLSCNIHCTDTVRRFLTVLRHHAYRDSSEPLNACFVGGVLSKLGKRFTFNFQLEYLFDKFGRMEYAFITLLPYVSPESGVMYLSVTRPQPTPVWMPDPLRMPFSRSHVPWQLHDFGETSSSSAVTAVPSSFVSMLDLFPSSSSTTSAAAAAAAASSSSSSSVCSTTTATTTSSSSSSAFASSASLSSSSSSSCMDTSLPAPNLVDLSYDDDLNACISSAAKALLDGSSSNPFHTSLDKSPLWSLHGADELVPVLDDEFV